MDLFIYLKWIYLLPIRKIKYTAKWEFQDKSRESDKYGLILIDDKKNVVKKYLPLTLLHN